MTLTIFQSGSVIDCGVFTLLYRDGVVMNNIIAIPAYEWDHIADSINYLDYTFDSIDTWFKTKYGFEFLSYVTGNNFDRGYHIYRITAPELYTAFVLTHR